VLKKKNWANFQRNIDLFTSKIVTKISKIKVWDPGSGKNLFRIPDPGVKKAPDPGSGSATLPVILIHLDEPKPSPGYMRIPPSPLCPMPIWKIL
jgi:hypothetical protein